MEGDLIIDDVYARGDRIQRSWEEEEEEKELKERADGEEEELNIFTLLLREGLNAHDAVCNQRDTCYTCRNTNADETFDYPEMHRFGRLNDRFQNKTLRQVIEELKGQCNPQASTVIPPPKTTKKREAETSSALRKIIMDQKCRRKSLFGITPPPPLPSAVNETQLKETQPAEG